MLELCGLKIVRPALRKTKKSISLAYLCVFAIVVLLPLWRFRIGDSLRLFDIPLIIFSFIALLTISFRMQISRNLFYLLTFYIFAFINSLIFLLSRFDEIPKALFRGIYAPFIWNIAYFLQVALLSLIVPLLLRRQMNLKSIIVSSVGVCLITFFFAIGEGFADRAGFMEKGVLGFFFAFVFIVSWESDEFSILSRLVSFALFAVMVSYTESVRAFLLVASYFMSLLLKRINLQLFLILSGIFVLSLTYYLYLSDIFGMQTKLQVLIQSLTMNYEIKSLPLGRYASIFVARDSLMESPFFGIGLGNYIFQREISPSQFMPKGFIDYAGMLLTENLAEFGLIGTAIWTLFMYRLFAENLTGHARTRFLLIFATTNILAVRNDVMVLMFLGLFVHTLVKVKRRDSEIENQGQKSFIVIKRS